MTQTPKTLLTHSGEFHADELLSTVVLSRIFPKSRIMRTRDEGTIEKAVMHGAVVYDVGEAYSPDNLLFDHHQIGAPKRADGSPFSAFGLIWKHFGMKFLAEAHIEPELRIGVWERIDKGVVHLIDLNDNGVRKDVDPLIATHTASELIEAFYPTPGEDRDENAAFLEALAFTRSLFDRLVARALASERAKTIVAEEIAKEPQAPILQLPAGTPHQLALDELSAGHVLYVVKPREGDWTLTAVNTHTGSFEIRAPLPAIWVGRDAALLKKITGIADIRFIHPRRFFAVTRTAESAIKLAELALADRQDA